ncbi:molybdopterin-binding protein [Brevibacterium salitolerans]|uniref:molybdopterin-binding protein n=1 Tax=Brevibacterium salitolerans TaxID=1403566 RepID=UPI0031D6D554
MQAERPDWRTAMALAHALGREALATRRRRDAADMTDGMEWLPLHDAAGRILAQELRTSIPVPHYPSSAMDGYAYAASPTAAAPPQTWLLEDWTGVDHVLAPGRACPVVTGRAVPHGTTGIIRSEYAQVTASSAHGAAPESAHGTEPAPAGGTAPTPAHGSAPGAAHGSARLGLAPDAPLSELEPGRHIRPAGNEASAGDLLAPAGTALTPPLLAMAAVCGHDVVPVLPAPRAALLYTGDEVISAGLPARGTVRDVFSVQLPHLLGLSGAQIVSQSRIGDDPAHTWDALTHMLAPGTDTGSCHAAEDADPAEATHTAENAHTSEEMTTAADAHPPEAPDLIVTTGGTGRSAADHIRSTLTALAKSTGGRIVFPELDMRPGHPTLLAALVRADGRTVPVLGLPGNPLAAMAAMRVAGRALIRGMRGAPAEVPLTVPLAAGSPRQKAERLVPARPHAASVRDGTDEPAWEPCTHSGPNMMRGLTRAQGWIVLPAHSVRTGERVLFLPLEW